MAERREGKQGNRKIIYGYLKPTMSTVVVDSSLLNIRPSKIVSV